MTSHTTFKNASYLTLAAIVQKLLSTLYFILIARFFTNAEVGQYAFALSFTTLFGVFVELGLSAILTREIARDATKIESYLCQITGIKLVSGFLIYIVVVVFAHLMHYDPLTITLIVLSGLVMLVDSFNVSFYAVFRGIETFQYEAYGVIIGQCILVTIGTIVILGGWPLPVLILALLSSSVFNCCFSLFFLRKKLSVRIRPCFDLKDFKKMLIIALPFTLAGIFMRVYGYIDTVLLYNLTNPTEVSYYVAAYKITFALAFIPAAVGSALFPSFARAYVSGTKESMSALFSKATYTLLILAVPIALGGMVLAKDIIPFIYSENYQPSILTLQLMMLALIFIFLAFPSGALLNACNYQKENTALMGVTLLVNVIANLILIPFWSYTGATVALIIASAVLFFGTLWYAQKIILYDRSFFVRGFFRSVISGLVMVVFLLLLRSSIHFLVLIFVGSILYFAVLYILKGYTKEDIVFFKEFLFSRRRSDIVPVSPVIDKLI